MAQKNFVDAIIVSSNRAVEKTTKKALHHSNTCCFASKAPEFAIEPREEVQLRTLHFSAMGRVSEAVSVKRGELLKILKLAESKRNTGSVRVFSNPGETGRVHVKIYNLITYKLNKLA